VDSIYWPQDLATEMLFWIGFPYLSACKPFIYLGLRDRYNFISKLSSRPLVRIQSGSQGCRPYEVGRLFLLWSVPNLFD